MELITIVLAEDHPITREGVRRLLAAESDMSLVGEAEDGPAAVELVGRLRPTVLILDMNLPSLDGFEVMLQVKQYSPQPRVIVFSMCDEEGYIWLTLRRGATGYVLKSAPADELMKGIREVAAGRRYLSSPLSDPEIEAYAWQGEPASPEVNASLTPREHEVLQLVAQGYTNARIAAELHLRPRTVAFHVHNLLSKLDARNRTEAVANARQRGWLKDE